jgi:cytochrome c biogenesis protein CcmG/thiol:disulfide interchange protein DsbE
MRRSAVPLLLGLIAVALVAMLGYAMARSSDDGTAETLDAKVQARKIVPAPGSDIELPRLGGSGTASLGAFRGKIVVLNFWASWCNPCRNEAPLLERVHRRLQRDGSGTVLGVTHQDSPHDSLEFVRKFKIGYPSLRDPGDKLSQKFGASQMPETFVIDREGRVRGIIRGEVDQKFLDNLLLDVGVGPSKAR